MEKMPRYAISNDASPCSMIVIQSFDINHVLWPTVHTFSWAAWTETFERRCTHTHTHTHTHIYIYTYIYRERDNIQIYTCRPIISVIMWFHDRCIFLLPCMLSFLLLYSLNQLINGTLAAVIKHIWSLKHIVIKNFMVKHSWLWYACVCLYEWLHTGLLWAKTRIVTLSSFIGLACANWRKLISTDWYHPWILITHTPVFTVASKKALVHLSDLW